MTGIVCAFVGQKPAIIEIPTSKAVQFESANSEYYYTNAVTTNSTTQNKPITISLWWKPVNSSVRGVIIGAMTSGYGQNAFFFENTASGEFRLYSYGSGGVMYDIKTPPLTIISNSWNHILMSVDVDSTATRKMFFNGQEVTGTYTTYNSSMSYSGLSLITTLGIGARRVNASSSDLISNGDLSQVWIDNSYIDLSSSTNVQKFYNNGWVNMGTDGTASGLNQPLIYHNGDTSTTPQFLTNQGRTGSNYISYTLTANGTISNSIGPTSTFNTLNTLTDIDSYDATWGYFTSYMGDDSNQNPVFAWTYKDASDNYIKLVAFRVDKTTGSITIGTPSSTNETGYQSPSIVSENEQGNIRTRGSNYGYIGYYLAGVGKIRAFSVDLSTLAVTIGASTNHSSASSSGEVDVCYVGNNRVACVVRDNSYYRAANLLSRSGTTLTSVASFTNSTARDTSMENAIGFVNSGSNYRWIQYGGTNTALNHPFMVAFHYYNSTGYTSAQDLQSVFSMASSSSLRSVVVNLNSSDKWLAINHASGGTVLKAVAGTISWGTGAPTFTNGSAITLTPTDTNPMLLSAGANDDHAYIFYEASSTLRYRKITASGTTLTEGSEVDTTLSSTNILGMHTVPAIAKSQSGDYLVSVVDDSSTNIPKVLAIKLN